MVELDAEFAAHQRARRAVATVEGDQELPPGDHEPASGDGSMTTATFGFGAAGAAGSESDRWQATYMARQS